MLPRPRATFVGRRAEIGELRAAVSEHALVSLVGPPGVGKTRLAVEAARGLHEEFGDRRWFADLAAVAAPELIASAVRAAVEAPTREGDTTADIVRCIGDEPALLVLDNCEHELAAVCALAGDLLARCENLCILATSRTELGIEAERVLVVRPLKTQSERFRRSDAVSLFYNRADARGAELRRDAAELELVASICSRLDGLPLAIELAASRSRVIALPDLLDRLTDPLRVLSPGVRRAEAGARSLTDAIASSFEACGERERQGFAALSVFAGSFALDAAQAVLESIGIASALDVIDTLVTCSLLDTVSDGEGRIRYRMLVVIRAFASEQAARSGADRELAREAHASWYASIGADLEVSWIGPRQADTLRLAELDLPNVREAATYAIEAGRPEHLLGLVLLPAAELWWATGRLQEGMYWLRRALAMPDLSPDLRFRSLMLGATFAYGLRLLDEGDRCIAEIALGIADSEDPYVRGAFAYAQGFGEIQHRSLGNAIATLAQSRRLGDADPQRMRMSLRARQLLVYAENLLGEDRAAAQTCSEILDLAEHTAETYFSSFAHQMLALYSWRRDARNDAFRHVRIALKACRDFPNRPENVDLLITCALLEERWGEPRRAEILLAAAGSVDSVGLRPATAAARDVEAVVAAILERTSKTSRATGATLTAREAIAFALGRAHPSSLEQVSLTRRETEVAHLIREGLANKQIAQALGLSVKTVEGHIARLMTKLGVSSRVQIAVWEPDRIT